MSRSPAFQFYPDDFRGGKAGLMTPVEGWTYVQLLCLDWSQDGFLLEPDRLAQWCGISAKQFVSAWERVSECFPVSEDGRYRNPRLQKEREKQAVWREKSSKGGRKGASTRAARVVDRVVDERLQPKGNTPSPTPVTTTTKATTSRASKPHGGQNGATKPHWLTPSCAVWESKNGAGSFPWGEAGKQLLPLRDHHPPEKIAAYLGEYLATTDPRFVSLAGFRKTFAQHDPIMPTDDFGAPLLSQVQR